uniref:Amidase domain-containing protein n=1 Tax=Parastrongyloides trichosuri TaxID=131310 RepID=A0A0N4Z7L9_PARTI
MVLLIPFVDSVRIYHLPNIVISFLQFLHNLYFFIVNSIFSVILSFNKRISIPRIKNDLLLIPAYEAARKIRDKEISSYQLVEAYVERQQEINPFINAVAQKNYDNALKAAKLVDEYMEHVSPNSQAYSDLAKNKPLFGVPFTVKDSVKCEEFIPIVGVVARLKGENIKNTDPCKGVERWKEAGGIILCTTNTPELCFSSECNNKVFGRTNNPYDIRRTTGGSSGGEGALIGSAGSLFGVGSDIGGSIRIPSGHCGIFGYKHTPRAISVVGHFPEFGGDLVNVFSQSPMARYVGDLKFVTRIFMSEEERNFLKFDEEVDFDKLKFYYIDNFDFMETAPISNDCKEGVRRIVKFLDEINKFPINLYFDEMKYGFNIFKATMKCYSNYDGVSINEYLTNGDKNKKVNCLHEAFKHLSGMGSDHDLASMLDMFESRYIRYLNDNQKRIYFDMKEKLSMKLDQILSNDGILIVPSYPSVAPPHNQQIFAGLDYTYTSIFNALGLPVISCPLYLNSENLPVSVQIVAGKNQDRLLFKFAEIIENKFGGWKEPR